MYAITLPVRMFWFGGPTSSVGLSSGVSGLVDLWTCEIYVILKIIMLKIKLMPILRDAYVLNVFA